MPADREKKAQTNRPATSESVERLAERIPPQNIEAERAVLGSMLLEGEAAGLAAEFLVPEDFYNSAHKTIFQAICEVYDSDQQPDEIVLTEHLRQRDLLDEAGGSEYIHALASSVPSAANVERYSRIVKEKAVARSLIGAATAILREAEDSVDMAELLDRSEQRIFDVASKRGASDVVRIRDILKEEFASLQERMRTPGLITGLPTGVSELDNMTGGLQRSDFIILAARPSVGKTAFALNLVEHLALEMHHPVLLFSLEMSRQQVALRLLCSHCNVDFVRLRSGHVEDDFQRIVDVGMGALYESPIFIDDKAAISGMELRAKARRMKSQHDARLIVVDYIQLMRGTVRWGESREREVAQLSSALKSLARELSVPVLALSQIRRAAEERRGGKPQLADLRESGALEQDADVVMILHRARDENGAQLNDATLNIAKQRNGPTGEIRLRFNPSRMRFSEQAYGSEF